MNQSEVFLLFDKLWIFPIRGGRENTNKKSGTVHAFSIFNQKNENKDESELEHRCIRLIELSISYMMNVFSY